MTQYVVSRITSGLGNQLFQYANGRHVSTVTERELLVDTSWYDFQLYEPKRFCRLRRLGLSATEEYARGLKRLVIGLGCGNSSRLRRIAQPFFKLNRMAVIHEAERFRKSPAPVRGDADGDLVLNGYWQTADHALAFGPEMYREILARWTFSPGAAQWLEKIVNSNSIFVHIRRGDYARWNVTMLDASYYRKAKDIIAPSVLNAEYFIFSEDVDWCEANLKFLFPAKLVEYSSPDRDIEDMLLMAACHGGIIANSSFSWWGAILSQHPGRPIAAPKCWWGTTESYFPDLFAPDWRLVE